MERRSSTLSIVCPAYQEEEVLPYFHTELCRVLSALESDFTVEILYVDDGSRDRTLEVLKDFARRDPRVRYLSLSRNFGHQAALTAGLEHASGDVVISLDADLQHPPMLIPRLIAKWREGFDIVLTVRGEDPKLSWFKKQSSRWFYHMMHLVSEVEMRDAAADYRLLSRRALDALLQLGESHRFVRGMVQWPGFAKAEVPFQPLPRKAGVSKYNFRRMARLAGDGLISFSKVPLRLAFALTALYGAFVTGGIALLALCGLLSLAWTVLLSSLLLLGCSALLLLGFLGEYVGRIFDEVRRRPVYLLKEGSAELRRTSAERAAQQSAA